MRRLALESGVNPLTVQVDLYWRLIDQGQSIPQFLTSDELDVHRQARPDSSEDPARAFVASAQISKGCPPHLRVATICPFRLWREGIALYFGPIELSFWCEAPRVQKLNVRLLEGVDELSRKTVFDSYVQRPRLRNVRPIPNLLRETGTARKYELLRKLAHAWSHQAFEAKGRRHAIDP